MPIYEDAPLVCDILEKFNIKKAHFHWFKGDEKTITKNDRQWLYDFHYT